MQNPEMTDLEFVNGAGPRMPRFADLDELVFQDTHPFIAKVLEKVVSLSIPRIRQLPFKLLNI